MNHAKIESSTVRVEGDKSYGMYFDGMVQRSVDEQKQVTNNNLIRQTRSVKPSVVPSSEKAPMGITGMVSLKKLILRS